MKPLYLILISAVISLEIVAQIPGGGNYYSQLMQPKEFKTWPVPDSLVQNDVNGQLVGYIPYDFYSALNCPVTHTLDTIINNNAGEDYEYVTIENNSECYAIIGKIYNGVMSDIQFIPINEYSNGKYRKTIDISYYDSALYRIIVTNGNKVFKKVVASDQTSNPCPDPGPVLLQDGNTFDVDAGTTSTNAIDLFNNCTIKIYDIDNNLKKTMSGKVSNNIFFLYGHVMQAIYKTYYDAQLPYERYCIFTAKSTNDVEMFLINSNNEVIAHNNDYTGVSDYDWGTEARVDLLGGDSLKAVVLIPYRPYVEYEDYLYDDEYTLPDSNPDGITDIYLGCKFFSMNNMSYYFPNLKSNDALISAGTAIDYNCHRWTAYPTTYLFRQPYLTGNHTSTSIAYYLCNYHGFTEYGATEDNSDVDIWEHLGYATHTSVRSYGGGAGGNSYGYDWESKLGNNKRIMHPRYALVNNDVNNYGAYGHVVKYLIKDPNYIASELVFENVEFTEDEHLQIASLAQMASQEEREYLSTMMGKIENSIFEKCISNLGLLSIYDKDYKELANTCSKSPTMQGLLLEKLSEGKSLAGLLFIDATRADNEDIIEKVTNYETLKTTTQNGEEIIRMDISEAILYAKEILAKLNGTERKSMEEGVSYSNEGSTISISVNGKTAQVSFDLNKESDVSLSVENVTGRSWMDVLDGKKLKTGIHRYSVHVDTSGIYAISLMINGRVYTKKFSVK